jgi:predicted AlkP superfamily pyrophosphatase or phosphodiesterase
VKRRLVGFALLLVVAFSAACASAGAQQRVVLISLDGFRADYLDRPAAVRLRALAARGVRAERLVPAFPSKTFPNHYTIVTGLYPGEHGIVANVVRDPELGLFSNRDTLAQWEPRWWGGEPIWVTAERQGLRAASLSWPGSEAPIGGKRQTWWQRYDHEMPRDQRVRRILTWLAMPVETAPSFITGYFHELDDAGHNYGPNSRQVDVALAQLDSVVGALVDGIAELGLSERVNLIFVSDHGMSATSADRVIVIDDLADLRDVEIVDLNPVAAIAPRPADVERVYADLVNAHPHLRVFRKGELPAAWHFNTHPRITPIVAVADDGWVIARTSQVARWREQGWRGGGTHGYPPELPSMGALFLAAGPGIAQGRTVPAFQNIHVYALMAHLLNVRPAANSGSLDSVRRVLR